VNWSGDGSFTNQMSQFLFMSTNFCYKTSRFIPRGNLGADLFNSVQVWPFLSELAIKGSKEPT
jgi:hypothetical protein